MNDSIRDLHQRLMQAHLALSRRLDHTADPAEAEAILREMSEINFRVMMTGRLLFKQTTETMVSRIATVIEASDELAASIGAMQEIRELIRAVGQFLTAADKVIDALKLA